MQMVYVGDGVDDNLGAGPDWAAYLPEDCTVHRLCVGHGYKEAAHRPEHILQAQGRTLPNAELVIISLDVGACLGTWLSALHNCAHKCPKIAIANLTPEYQKALLVAGLDAVLPSSLPADVLAAQMVAFVRLQRKYRPVARHGPVHFHNQSKRALVAEQDLQLTAREYDILHFIAQANGRPVGPAELLRSIFGLSFDPGTNIAAVHIYRLRKKLAGLGFAHILQTVQGRGYRLLSAL